MKAGPYEVRVTARANCRRLILHYNKSARELSLSVPVGTPERVIRAFLSDHMDWIRQQMGSPVQWQPVYAAGERHWCFGRLVTLGVDAPEGEAAYLQWRNGRLIQVLRRLLEKWTARMGVRITHVTVQEMTSRWGSCRKETGRLTFNTRLAMYEEVVIEETVVHELCHLFHAKHSAAFYAEMTRWLPDWKQRKAVREGMDVRPQPPERS